MNADWAVPAPARIAARADDILVAVRSGGADCAAAQAMIGAALDLPCAAIALADAGRSLPDLRAGDDALGLYLPASVGAGGAILMLGQDGAGRRLMAMVDLGAGGAGAGSVAVTSDIALLAVPAGAVAAMPCDRRLPDLAELLFGYAQLGLLLAMYDRSLDYVAARRGTNGALGDRPGVRQAVAELFLAMLGFRAMLDRCVDRIGDAAGFAAALALARLHWFDTAPGCAIRCMDLHGGVATLSDQPMRALHRAFLAFIQLPRGRAAWVADAVQS